MKDTSERITRIAQELRALQVQLQWTRFQKSSPDDKTEILNGLLNSGLVEDLKTAVEHLSRFPWCYIDSAAAANSIHESDHELQSKRLGRVAEMLCTLRQPACAGDAPMGFVERVTASVDQHLEAQDHPYLSDLRSA